MKQPRNRVLFVFLLALAIVVGCNQSGGEGTSPTDGESATTANSTPIADAPPARGETHGLPFELQRADMQNNILTLHGDEGRTFFVFLFLEEGENAAGNRFRYTSAEIGDPHIHMHYRSAEGIEIDTFMEDYSLELEFGEPVDGRISGRIDLKLPDDAGSHVAGSFEAELTG